MPQKKILVVEDNEIGRRLLNAILRASGYVVLMAKTGALAIKLAQQGGRRKPHLILLDMRLPDICGLEVARMLKSSPGTGNIPIIAVTAYAMPGDAQKVMESGCNAYVSKPINVRDLTVLVETFLSWPQRRHPAGVLPPAGLKRWSAWRKAAVMIAVRSGAISVREACDRYILSEEELSQWEGAFNRDGVTGLRVKSRSRR
jgi:two-component system, cell cycle response regulator DivK